MGGSIIEKQVQNVLSGRFDIKNGLSVDFEHAYSLYVTLWPWTASIGERRMVIAHKHIVEDNSSHIFFKFQLNLWF
jgi:hypothetical protein